MLTSDMIWKLFERLEWDLAKRTEGEPVNQRIASLQARAANPLGDADFHSMMCSQAFSEGWKYGPERNEAEKTAPVFVPWTQLMEQDRADFRRWRLIARAAAALVAALERREVSGGN